MLLNNTKLRYEKVFSFVVNLHREFDEQNCGQNTISCPDWEALVYHRFIQFLGEFFPEDGLIIEDFETKNSGNDYIWLCDPVDGTSNMFTGVSFFSMVFSLVYQNKQPVLSFIVDMIQGQVYIAYGKENSCYCISKDLWIPVEVIKIMPNDEYVLIGKIFGHTLPEKIEYIQKDWWNLAAHSKSYRQLGSVALQMLLDGWKRHSVIVSLQIRWFDVVASLHFLNNLGYQYQISTNRECLLAFRPEILPCPPLEKLIETVEKKWKFLPLNTLDISR